MEKLEEHIKEKLEQRKLSPSSGAWEKVSASLGVEVKTTNKNWYAVAATLIGLLIASIAYYNYQNTGKQSTQVAIEKGSVTKKENTIKRTELVEIDTANKDFKSQESENKATTIKNNLVAEKGFQKHSGLVVVEEKVRLKTQIKDNTLFLNPTPQDIIIDKKVNEVLAAVINIENKSKAVSDAEVDSLLRLAQRDILKEKLFQDNGKIDAMALLTEVEDELDQSFRDKIFKKLKEGLFKARTAIADRNN